jgi:YafQ family addiction module toxin component
MYRLNISKECEKIFFRLAKKNPKQLEIIHKKILEIRSNPFHEYKSLRAPLNGYNRVHIDKHFVMIFRIDHENLTVEIIYYGHHDNAYFLER